MDDQGVRRLGVDRTGLATFLVAGGVAAALGATLPAPARRAS